MLYKVKIESYNEITNKEEIEYLILAASSYNDCMNELTELYGDDSIIATKIKSIAPDNYIIFKEDEKPQFKNLTDMIEERSIW